MEQNNNQCKNICSFENSLNFLLQNTEIYKIAKKRKIDEVVEMKEESNKKQQIESSNEENINELKPFEYKANEIINLHYVSNKEEMEDESLIFKPWFTHQFFGDSEIIRGYEGLKVDIYFLSGTMSSFLQISYEKKHEYSTDIQKKLTEKMFEPKLQPDEQEFEINDSFSPASMGTKINSYTNKENQDLQYEIFQVNISNVLEFHKKIRFFVLLFIDNSSYFEIDDPNWELFLEFERNKQTNRYKFVGFVTVYKFYHFPQHVRRRISQFFILPPFHKKGHGGHLLESIYSISKQDERIYDITVEDPSLDFTRLRDFIDFKNCKEQNFFNDTPHPIYNSDVVAKIVSTLKIHRTQVRKMYEIFGLMSISRNNEAQYKVFRLAVKKRLSKQFSDILDGFETSAEKKKELHTIYQEVEVHYLNLIEKLAKTE